MILAGGFSARYEPLPSADPCTVCVPDTFNGNIILKPDFQKGTIWAGVEGGAGTSTLWKNCATNETEWYYGLFEFKGEASGALDSSSGSFSLEVAVDCDVEGQWRTGCENCPLEKSTVRRTILISGQAIRDGLGSGKLLSEDGPCRIEGEWQIRKADFETTPAPQADRLESIPKDLNHYRYQAVIPKFVPEKGPALQDFDPFSDMVDELQGELEIKFFYQASDGSGQALSFQKPMSELVVADEAAREQKRAQGEMCLLDKESRRLELGYKVLDEMEKTVRTSAGPAQASAAGREAFRGSELDFHWRIILRNPEGRVVASSESAGPLKYVLRYPVVFLPGTAGSRLSVSAGGALEEVWPANLWRGTQRQEDRRYWQRLALSSLEPRNAVTATDIFRYYGQTWEPLVAGLTSYLGRAVRPSVKSVYQGFLDHMAGQGYAEYPPAAANGPAECAAQINQRLFLFPYDWRLDIETHLPALDSLVERALDLHFNRQVRDFGAADRPAYARQEGDKVILIGHSQGSLVMRAYVGQPERRAKVDSLIMLGPPNLGSLNTFKALAGSGYNFEALFLHPEVGKWIGRDWVSPYQMLPHTETGDLAAFLFDEKGNPVPDVLQELKSLKTHVFCNQPWPLSGGGAQDGWPLNSDRLDQALRFFHSLPNPAALGVPTFILAVYDQPTIVGFRKRMAVVRLEKSLVPASQASTVAHSALRGLLRPEFLCRSEYPIVSRDASTVSVSVPIYEEIIRPCGDGTVPYHSLTGLAGAKVISLKGIKHGGLAESPEVQSLTDQLLSGRLPAVPAAPGCSSEPSSLTVGLVVAAFNSPAFVHIYDAQKRHTGVASQGEIEEGIPGSWFEVEGNHQRAWLPYSQEAFRVELEGTLDTEATVVLLAGDGRSEKRAEYTGIRETPGLRAEIRFSVGDLGAQTAMLFDRDGDGHFEETQAPDSFSETAGGDGGGEAVRPKDRRLIILLGILLLGILAVALATFLVWRKRKRSV